MIYFFIQDVIIFKHFYRKRMIANAFFDTITPKNTADESARVRIQLEVVFR